MSENTQPVEYTPQPVPAPEQPSNPPPSSTVTSGDVAVEPTLPIEEEVLPPEESSPEPPTLEQRLQAVNALESQSDRLEHKLDLLLELGHGVEPASSLPQYAAGIRAAEPPTHLPVAGPSPVLPEVAFYPEGTPPEEQHDQPQVGPQSGIPTTQYFPPPPVMTQTGAVAPLEAQ